MFQCHFFVRFPFSANFGILVRKCYAFDDLQDSSVRLVDSRGCSERKLLSPFEYDADTGSASATLYSMFRYIIRRPNSFVSNKKLPEKNYCCMCQYK